MGSRAEHRAIAEQAVKDAMAADARGDMQTYQRERRVAIAHGVEAQRLAAADQEEGR